jgi:hypothetical protein
MTRNHTRTAYAQACGATSEDENVAKTEDRNGKCRRISRLFSGASGSGPFVGRPARGMALVWTAVILLVLLGFVGLAVDSGKLAWNVHQMQNGADAAALAGAQVVKFAKDEAVTRAHELGLANWADRLPVTLRTTPQPEPFGDSEDGLDIILGRWIRQRQEFLPMLDAPNAVKAIVRRQDGLGEAAPPLASVFGRIFGVDTVAATRSAIGFSQGSTGAGLITLREYPPEKMGISIGGDVVIQVNGGDVQDNSQSLVSPKEAFRASGSFIVNCKELNVCGEIYPPEEDAFWQSVDYSVNSNTRVPLPDPLGYVADLWSSPPQGTRPSVIAPPPPQGAYPAAIEMETHDWGLYGMAVEVDPATGVPVLGADGKYISRGIDISLAEPITGSTINKHGQVVAGVQTLTLVPGYYPGGFILSEGGKIKLLPGVYAFGGGNKNGDKSGVVMTGGVLEGLGVMLYVTASNQPGKYLWGRVELNGGEILLREGLDPDDPEAEPYPGYAGTDYKYIAIFQDRANPSEAKITGNVTFTQLTGVLYFPTAHMVFSGTGIETGSQLIAGSIETQGTTSLTINYNGRFMVAGYRSILVQ